jgi:hypothetical protein
MAVLQFGVPPMTLAAVLLVPPLVATLAAWRVFG